MIFNVSRGVVVIVCTPLEGKILMQGANLMSHDMDNVEEHIVENHVKNFGAASKEEFFKAIEECVITLPHEDNEEWNK